MNDNGNFCLVLNAKKSKIQLTNGKKFDIINVNNFHYAVMAARRLYGLQFKI